MNGHFFVSGILYETLKLIRKMSGLFTGDKSFETSLRVVLKDTSGQAVEKMHLKPLRHGAVFHFAPDRFTDAIAKTPLNDCFFVSSIGEKRGSIHYSFADAITAEIMVGGSLKDTKVVNEMMVNMLKLVRQLVEHSENFIADQLSGWGFEVKTFAIGFFICGVYSYNVSGFRQCTGRMNELVPISCICGYVVKPVRCNFYLSFAGRLKKRYARN